MGRMRKRKRRLRLWEKRKRMRRKRKKRKMKRSLILLLPVLLVLFLAGTARTEGESSLVGDADLHSNLLPAGEKVAVREAREAGIKKKDSKKEKLKDSKGKNKKTNRIN